ncbi:aldo/keto reductase [Roseibacterium sp. SDUM158017]|uniref:aldo/keto reductase n=1 Tax=Roseicyclus salinarum TaxID=3036773 RepID=UPI00241564DD|nr:aldo/keto reductase [Roseibacterium sp. SDUM158017]MDG4648702.1 aldo/keto reductase [Roseibacterium sp. SDUM158017]
MKPDLRTPAGHPISSYCFGTMQWGGKADRTDSRAMYDRARAAGINFFDTAHGYTGGASETLLGQFVVAERDHLFIATKCASTGNCAPEAIAKDLDESLRRLDLDFVDLLYMHRWSDEVPLEATYEALAKMVDAGRVRHIGVSNYAAWQVMKAAGVAATFELRIETLQPMYNLVKRQAEVEMLPMCTSENIAVVPYSPLGGGLLTGKYKLGQEGRLTHDPMYKARYGQDWMHETANSLHALAAELGVSAITLAIAWVARNPAITAPILSASRSDQMQPSLDAIGFELDDETYARLTALSPTPPPATDRLEEA